MKQLTQAIKNLSSTELFSIYNGKPHSFSVAAESFSLISKEDLLFDRMSKDKNLLIESYQNITVVLDGKLTEELYAMKD